MRMGFDTDTEYECSSDSNWFPNSEDISEDFSEEINLPKNSNGDLNVNGDLKKDLIFKRELARAKNIIQNINEGDEISKRISNIMIIPENTYQNEKDSGISKLSPFVSNRIEHTLIDYLNETTSYKSLLWKRYEGKFPDLQLEHKDGSPSKYGIEVKVICATSEEPSARFWHATHNFEDYESQYVVILSWKLSNNVYGFPSINNSVCINAKKLAEDRDLTIHQPPRRIVCQPRLDSDKKNKQTDIKVLIFQENNLRLQEATDMIKIHNGDEESLVDILTMSFKYREDSNSGKLNRIKNEELTNFIKKLKSKN